MKKLHLALAAVALIASLGAHAQITHFLVAEWNEGGNHMCRYDNGTVLNVGYRVCPLSI